MKCAIYARYSSDMQKPESAIDQIQQCRKHIESKGWTVADNHIYKDEAISGADDKRAEYLKMKAAAQSREWDCVVVDDLSRLGRHTIESLMTFEELNMLGVNIIGVADGIDTTGGKAKLPYFIKSMMNELFLDDLREKVKRGQAGQVRRGYNAGGRLFGYRYNPVFDPNGAKDRDGNPKRLGVEVEINPEQAEVVRQIFELKAKGYGLKAIAHYLNDHGFMPPHGNGRNKSPRGWCTSTVRSIFQQTKYIGDWSWGKTKWVKRPGTSKKTPVPQPKSEWTQSIRPELRIVDQILWDKAQQGLSKNTNAIRKANGHFNGSVTTPGRPKHLFSGLLKCGKCGASMIILDSGNYSAYVCNNCWNRGKSICDNNRRILRSTVEKRLLKGIQKRVLEPDSVDKLVTMVNRKITDHLKRKPNQLASLEDQVKQLENEIDNLTGFILKGNSSSRVAEMLAERESKLAMSKAELESRPADYEGHQMTVDAAWVKKRIADLRGLFACHKSKMHLVRQEVKALLGDKIRLIPLPDGKKWAYKAETILKPANVLIGHPTQQSIIAVRGIEPRFAD